MRRLLGWLRKKLPMILTGMTMIEKYGSARLFPFFFLPLETVNELGRKEYTFLIFRSQFASLRELFTETRPIAECYLPNPKNIVGESGQHHGKVFIKFHENDLTVSELQGIAAIRDTIENFLIAKGETQFFKPDTYMPTFVAKREYDKLTNINKDELPYEVFQDIFS